MYEYNATLHRVIDADTYVLDVDLGLRVSTQIIVRLRGADAPERFTTAGKVATQKVLSWFGNAGLLTIRTYKGDEHDKYGRWVADVTSVPLGSLADFLITNDLVKQP